MAPRRDFPERAEKGLRDPSLRARNSRWRALSEPCILAAGKGFVGRPPLGLRRAKPAPVRGANPRSGVDDRGGVVAVMASFIVAPDICRYQRVVRRLFLVLLGPSPSSRSSFGEHAGGSVGGPSGSIPAVARFGELDCIGSRSRVGEQNPMDGVCASGQCEASDKHAAP